MDENIFKWEIQCDHIKSGSSRCFYIFFAKFKIATYLSSGISSSVISLRRKVISLSFFDKYFSRHITLTSFSWCYFDYTSLNALLDWQLGIRCSLEITSCSDKIYANYFNTRTFVCGTLFRLADFISTMTLKNWNAMPIIIILYPWSMFFLFSSGSVILCVLMALMLCSARNDYKRLYFLRFLTKKINNILFLLIIIVLIR